MTLALPIHLVIAIHDIAKAVGPRSDGGKKITEAEAAKLREDAQRLLRDLEDLVESFATQRAR